MSKQVIIEKWLGRLSPKIRFFYLRQYLPFSSLHFYKNASESAPNFYERIKLWSKYVYIDHESSWKIIGPDKVTNDISAETRDFPFVVFLESFSFSSGLKFFIVGQGYVHYEELQLHLWLLGNAQVLLTIQFSERRNGVSKHRCNVQWCCAVSCDCY